MSYSNYTNLFCDEIKNSTAKLAFFLTQGHYSFLTFQCDLIGIIFETKILRYPNGFALFQNSDIFQIFEETLQHLISSGITLHHDRLDERSILQKEQEKEPKVLAINDLSFGFVVWLIACGISLLGFFVEILFKIILGKLRVSLRDLCGLYVLIKLIKMVRYKV